MKKSRVATVPNLYQTQISQTVIVDEIRVCDFKHKRSASLQKLPIAHVIYKHEFVFICIVASEKSHLISRFSKTAKRGKI